MAATHSFLVASQKFFPRIIVNYLMWRRHFAMTSYNETRKISRPALIAALGFSIGLAVPAQAGFQWITPLDSAPVVKSLPLPQAEPVSPKKELPPVVQLPVGQEADPAAMPEVLVPPAESPAPVVVAPAVVEPVAPVAAAPAVVEPAAPVVVASPVEAPSEPVEAVVVPVEDVVAAPELTGEGKLLSAMDSGEKIEGFGKAMPLVVALKQTLPRDYIFAFEESVRPGTPVDWKGGRGWRVVLADALAGAGLVGYEQGNKVSVFKADSAVPAEPVKADEVLVPMTEAAPSAVEIVPASDDTVAVPPPTMIEVPPAVEPVAVPATPAVEPNAAQAPVEIVPEQPKSEEVVPDKQGAVVPEVQQAVLAEPVAVTAPTLAAPELPLAVEAETKQEGSSAESVTVAPSVPAASEVPVKGQVVMPNASLEPPLLPGASDVWRAEPGEHLRDVIRRWASRAGVDVVWSTEYDFPIQAGVSLNGSFEEAVRDLLSGFVDAKPQPFGRLHDNPNAGQRTLVVQTRGNTGAE